MQELGGTCGLLGDVLQRAPFEFAAPTVTAAEDVAFAGGQHITDPVKQFAELKVDIGSRSVTSQDRVTVIDRRFIVAGIFSGEC